ncbi:TetR/AcrR family transcriptional regulator [Planococcus sp. 1R117A]|uniref:TetR/AcrR family transcriptional regulator n=1 Tax=Planococcus sp. 1R117A TaxID=3447020 RepID=UPI003EDC807C
MEIKKEKQKSIVRAKSAFINAYIQLIEETGDPQNITVSEIAAKAEYSRSAFYFHFKDKEAINEALFNIALGGIYEALTKPYKKAQEISLDSLVPSRQLFFEFIEKERYLFCSLNKLSLNPSIFDRMEEVCLDVFLNRHHLNINTNVIDYEIAISYHFSALIGMTKYWIINNFKYSSHYMAEQMAHISLYPPVSITVTDSV